MLTLVSKKTKIRTKRVTLYIVPFYNHWYGAMVYLKKPKIDEWGLNAKPEKGFEVSIKTLLDCMGIKLDYEKLDYDHFKKEFEDMEGGFKGGLTAEPIKVTGLMPVDKDGDIIFAF